MRSISAYPDLILFNAKIYTVDADQPWAQAIAITCCIVPPATAGKVTVTARSRRP